MKNLLLTLCGVLAALPLAAPRAEDVPDALEVTLIVFDSSDDVDAISAKLPKASLKDKTSADDETPVLPASAGPGVAEDSFDDDAAFIQGEVDVVNDGDFEEGEHVEEDLPVDLLP